MRIRRPIVVILAGMLILSMALPAIAQQETPTPEAEETPTETPVEAQVTDILVREGGPSSDSAIITVVDGERFAV